MDSFQVGDVVTFVSHPFVKLNKEIVITGEAALLPPLMIIIEILVEVQSSFNEATGEVEVRTGESSCKCLYFSSKNARFEESVLSSKSLRMIEKATTSEPLHNGGTVALKSINFELSKRKSFLTLEERESYSESDRVSTVALLSYVSPIMYAMNKIARKEKEGDISLFDRKTGIQKRFLSKNLWKCKWFDPTTDKFSELVIPQEALTIIPTLDEQYLSLVGQWIKDHKVLVGNLKSQEKYAVFRAKQLCFRSGTYLLRGFNYITNRNETLNIEEVREMRSESKHFSRRVPTFTSTVDGNLQYEPEIEQIVTLVEAVAAKMGYLRIRYKNRRDKYSFRTISRFSIKHTSINEIETKYISGYCHLKNEERTFRLDRIIAAEDLII